MQEIAEALKTQREAKGLTIDDLFQRTRINRDFLNALETGQFDLLPDAYAKLFLKKFAQEVGLDVELILAQYDRHAPRPKPPAPIPPPINRKRNFQPVILIAIGVFVVSLLVWQIRQQDSQSTAAPLDTTLTVPRPTQSTQQTTPNTQSVQADPVTPTLLDVTSQPSDALTPQLPEIPIPQPGVSSPADTEQITEPAQATQPAIEEPNTLQDLSLASESEAPLEQIPEDIVAETPLAPNTSPEPLIPNEQPLEESKTQPIIMPLPAIIAPDNPIILSAITQQTTYLLVKADGRTLFDGQLQAGSRPRWAARDSLELTLTDRNAIVLSLQNQPLQFDASTTQAIHMSITRTQISILPSEY